MQSNFISLKDFDDTRTIYSANKPVEIFMDNDTENIIDKLFNTILNRVQQVMETSNERESGFSYDSGGLLYYHFQKIDIRRGGSYIMSPDWIANKKATINPKNEKDSECFIWAIIAESNFNKIKEKELKKLQNLEGLIQTFHHHIKGSWDNLNKKILQLLLIFYFYHTIVKK